MARGPSRGFSSRVRPGTGKTLVARYLATEAEALFVDVHDFPRGGAALEGGDVRALFAHARAVYAETGRPVVLFWDEFHEVACGPPCTIGAILAELDGVRGRPAGVLMVAATSNAHGLPPSLLRPGRLGRTIPFNPPDADGRLLLLTRRLAALDVAEPVDLGALEPLLGAELTAAGIEEAVASAWQAAVGRAIRDDEAPALRYDDLEAALLDRLLGPRPPFARLCAEERQAVAVHECGHAFVAATLGVPLRLATLRPGGKELGRLVTRTRRERTSTLAELNALIRVALAGVEAERIAGVPASAGGNGDFGMATSLALQLVDVHGEGRHSGPLNPNPAYQRQTSVELSEYALARLDADVMHLLSKARRDARRILRRIGPDPIHELAAMLVERETMLAPELERAISALVGDPTAYASRRRRDA